MKFTEWQVKMVFGFLLLLALLVLAVMVAREGASLQGVNNTDLQQVLTLFAVMAGSFAQWAFATHNGAPPPGGGDKK